MTTKLNFKNISYLFNQNVVRLFISLFVGAWVARHLNVENYGKFNFVLSFLFLYKPLITFGMDEVIINQVGKSNISSEKILGTTFIFRMLTFIIFYFAAIPLLLSIGLDEEVTKLTMLFLVSMISIPFSNTEMYLNAKHQVKDQALYRSYLFILLAIVKVIFILLNFELLFFILISTFEIILMSIISFLIFYKKYPKLRMNTWSFDLTLLKSLLKDAFPVMISLVVFRGMSKIDQLFIAKYTTMNSLGLYGAAAKLLDSWQFLPSIISTIYLSKLNKSKDNINEYFCLLNISSLCLVGGCYILGSYIISFLYGDNYLGAIKFLKLYSLQFFFIFFALGRLNYFLSIGKSTLNLILASFIFALNILLNFYLIEKLGAIGVIYASITANVFGLFIFSIFSRDVMKVNFNYMKSIFYLKSVFKKLI